MSQETTKVNVEESPEETIRKFKRGDEDLDLDALLNNISSGYDNFANGLVGQYYKDYDGKWKKIKDKDLDELRKSYNTLYGRLSSGEDNFRYDKVNKGFIDTTGVLGNKKNIYDSIVATYFGNAIRGASVYKAPEPTPDPNKIKYGDDALSKAISKRILGSAGTIDDFISKDIPDSKTGIRSTKERAKILRNVLQEIYDGWDSAFSDFTEDQSTKGKKDIESLFPLFDKDGEITDNEILDLARVTGISGLRDWFTTTSRTDSFEDRTTKQPTKADFYRWLQENHAPHTGEFRAPIDISNLSTKQQLGISDNTANILQNWMATGDTKELYSMLSDLLEQKDPNMNAVIRRLFPQGAPFAKDRFNIIGPHLIRSILENLRSRKELDPYNLGEAGLDSYYLPGITTDRNSYFTWNTSNNTLSEISGYDIPQIRTQWYNEWRNTLNQDYGGIDPKITSSYAGFSFKEGGTIRKFQDAGTVMPKANVTLSDKYNWNDIFSDYSQNIIDLFKTIQSATFLSPAQKRQAMQSIVDNINNMQKRHYGIFKGKYDNTSIRPSDKSVEDYQKEIIDKYSFVNDAIGKHQDFFNIINSSAEGLDTPGTWNPDNRGEGFTWSRFILGDTDHLKDDDSFWEELKKYGVSHNTKEGFGNYNFLSLIDKQKPDKSDIEEDDTDNSRLEEGDTRTKKTPKVLKALRDIASQTGNILSNATPDILNGVGMATSLRYNKKIEKSLQPHYFLRDPINLHKELLGNWAIRQASRNEAAKLESSARRNAVSDASLTSANIMDANRKAVEIAQKGDLYDNEAIRQSQKERFDLEKELAFYNKNKVWDWNKEKISQASNIKGQLRASRLNKDWRSINNFIKSTAQNWRDRIDERYKDALDYQKLQDEQANALKYQPEFDQIASLQNKWISENPGKSISSAPWYTQVTQRLSELTRRKSNDDVLSAGKRRGVTYTDLFKDDPYKVIDWTNIIK